jgi:DNA-binding NtrC family response regulator
VARLCSAVEARARLGELGTWQFDRSRPTGSDFIGAVVDQNISFPRARQTVVEELERQYVEAVLARHGGSVARAAQASGVALRYFQLIRARRSK